MKVLLFCEESQAVTKEFRSRGHEAYSCDILPCSGGKPEWHIQSDGSLDILNQEWDMIIAFPPCTYLTVTGNKWFYHPEDKHLPIEERRPHPKFPDRQEKRKQAIEFFKAIYNAKCEKIAIENPVGIMSSNLRKPDQIVHPYHFGDPHAKKTCLWLKGLPKLEYTNVVEPEYVTFKSGKRMAKWYVEAAKHPPAMRSKIRSKTFPGIAKAMADQWG